jgi:hypothetical protein
MLRRFMISLTACAAAIVVGGGTSLAAPQVLGLTASLAPISFHCDGDTCAALAGTFCLQHERVMPTTGTRYRATHPERVTLVLFDGEGDALRIAGDPWISFAAYDGYTMVRMSVPRRLLAERGAAAVGVDIGPGVALVPVSQAGDGNPQSADEIALAAGPLRLAAAPYLDRPAIATDSARLLAALVNAMPEQQRIADDRVGLWQRTITGGLEDALTPGAVAGARAAYDGCGDLPDLRHCLIARHRDLMERGNIAFWDETAGY